MDDLSVTDSEGHDCSSYEKHLKKYKRCGYYDTNDFIAENACREAKFKSGLRLQFSCHFLHFVFLAS